MKKRIVIIVIVLIVLLGVLFLLPDSFYKKYSKYSDYYDRDYSKEKVKVYSLDEKFEHLFNNKYDYKYLLSNPTYTYSCNGTRNGMEDDGGCTKPEDVNYDKDSVKDVYKNVNTKYLDMKYVYDLIKDEEYKEDKYSNLSTYTYNIISNELETEIVVYTDKENIIQIDISNRIITYVLYFSNVVVD